MSDFKPTMSIVEFQKGEEKDDNLFWRLPCGDHQNLLDEALAHIEKLEMFQKLHQMPGACACDHCMAIFDKDWADKRESDDA